MSTTSTTPTTRPAESTQTPVAAHYKEPDWFTRHIFNSVVKGLTHLGVSVWGSRILEHRGRTTGELHHVPVNLLTIEGTQYLVAPRGQAQWVRNLRAAGQGELRVGRRTQRFTATEMADADKPPVLREYLRKWGWEVGRFFEGVTADATEEQIRGIAPGFPVFRITIER